MAQRKEIKYEELDKEELVRLLEARDALIYVLRHDLWLAQRALDRCTENKGKVL